MKLWPYLSLWAKRRPADSLSCPEALFRAVFARRRRPLCGGPRGTLEKRRLRDSQAARLRREAARRCFAGGSHLTLGLTGICLVKRPTLLTEDEELESVCFEIRGLCKEEPDEVPASVGLADLDVGDLLGTGCNAAVYAAKWKHREGPDLAVKMLFNYDAESNAAAIWRSMYRECLPARLNLVGTGPALPPHPNVVRMPAAFVDCTATLPGAHRLYPAALPRRLDRRGCGRNATLFLVMERYACNLRDFLSRTPVDGGTAATLLCQLLEALEHLRQNRVVHRDLKTDNLLVDLSAGPSRPRLVLADFGCCLTGNPRVPFHGHEVCREGNLALMAPEVAGATPGPFSVLDYSRADLWAAGTLAYEIYGSPNPFYDGGYDGAPLESRSYRESDLPDPPRGAPPVVRDLVRDVLRRDPSQRPAPALAATVCQVLLHAPVSFSLLLGKKKRTREVVRWLCLFAAQTALKAARDPAAAALALTFLARVDVAVLLEALQYVERALKTA